MPDKQRTNKKPKMNNKLNNDVSCRNNNNNIDNKNIENKNDISDDNRRR